ncbi:MAG: carboxypeptidase-like regulatory domain-containing protein, partial [Chloroflexota bacterium]|nr:carboxypeptidase-like regulatory domain-containing protein [Chloroflexota bacterium]
MSLDCGIEGVVADAETSLPITGAEVVVSETGQTKYTNANGCYRFFLPPGQYTLCASSFGYESDAAAASVVENVHTAQDFSLVPMPTGTISGVVTDAETGEPLDGVTVRAVDTPVSTTSNASGLYSLELPSGVYDISVSLWGYKTGSVQAISLAGGQVVTVDMALVATARVAVLGDYMSQLVELLGSAHISAEERDWDVVDDMERYDVVLVNCPVDPGSANFLQLLSTADSLGVGCVFTSSWTGTHELYGISLLQTYVGDPAGYGNDYSGGDVYYQVREDHPLFAGWEPGDRVDLIVTGGGDHAWYVDYSGDTLADLGADEAGIRGGGAGVGTMGESLHVLLAGLGPQRYANLDDWTQDARTILVRAVLLAGGEAAIHVEPASFDVTTGRDQVVTATMVIDNAGSGALEFTISDVDSGSGTDAPWLSVDALSGSLAPQADAELEVTFDTSDLDPAEYSAEIIIDCNDPDRPQVVVPAYVTVEDSVPEIDISPAYFDEVVDAGETAVSTMTVHNLGNGTLRFSMSDVDSGTGLDATWLSQEPPAGTVPAGGDQNVTLTFDASDLDVGVYVGEIAIESNDSDEDLVTLPVTLTVPAADIDVIVPEPLN